MKANSQRAKRRDDYQVTHCLQRCRKPTTARDPADMNRPGFRALSVMCDRSVDRRGFWHGIRLRVRRGVCGRVDA